MSKSEKLIEVFMLWANVVGSEYQFGGVFTTQEQLNHAKKMYISEYGPNTLFVQDIEPLNKQTLRLRSDCIALDNTSS